MKQHTGVVLAWHTDIGLISLSVEFPWSDLVFSSASLTHYINKCVMGKIKTAFSSNIVIR
jgi:hypothetical protein